MYVIISGEKIFPHFSRIQKFTWNPENYVQRLKFTENYQ